ncbi:tumor necrosis factor ligand superfamily member 6 isoform X2 [Stigmatopora nigra]
MQQQQHGEMIYEQGNFVDRTQLHLHQHQPDRPPVWPRRDPKGSGVIPKLATAALLLLFLVVFAALGFGGYLVYNMQMEMKDLRKMTRELKQAQESSRAQRQIGFKDETGRNKDDKKKNELERTAAHVIGRIEKSHFPKTLRWDSRISGAFTGGGVAYRVSDGALRVNHSGLYHVYSRVELIFKHCSPTSSFVHTVFVRSPSGDDSALLEAHRVGFCSQRPERGSSYAWTTDSYLASALNLRQNQSVLVKVSHPQYLSHSSHANFFGLYEI